VSFKCVYCGVDCKEYKPEHGPECPCTTGLWPVTEEDLGIRGPNDPYAHGMICMDCASVFTVGDLYALRPSADWFEVVCLGCAALTVPLEGVS
jgi:hypothetical protein